jgi:hypothetical protein
MLIATKICKTCKIAKTLDDFSKLKSVNGNIYHRSSCKECRKPIVKEINRKHRKKNRENLIKRSAEWYLTVKDDEIYKEKVAENSARWNLKNKDKVNARAAERERKKRKNPVYRIRLNVGRSVREALSIQGVKKGWRSFFDYVDYTLEDLKIHLESLFEPWMTQNNYGSYSVKNWNDNDSSTWTWNIDHIIPQSDLPFESMEDENFKKCWALTNLRPYSSKQNNIDGATHSRHNKKRGK